MVWSRGNRSPSPVLVKKESGRIGFELGVYWGGGGVGEK